MVYALFTSLAQSSFSSFSDSRKLISSKYQSHGLFLNVNAHKSFNAKFSPRQSTQLTRLRNVRRSPYICFFNGGGKPKGDLQETETGAQWQILKRWEVPWEWQTVSLTSLACGLSFVLTGLVETAAIPYLGLRVQDLSIDEKAEILFLDQSITTAAVPAVLYTVASTFQPLPQDVYRYDLKDPFSLQKGWLLWAGIRLAGAIATIAVTGAAASLFMGESPESEKDALVSLLPHIGSSSVSTACLLGITGVLAQILEETEFRGFFMVSMTKWVPTPVAIGISAAVFALAHLTPGEFPQLYPRAQFISCTVCSGIVICSNLQPFNPGVILLLTFLQLQGYDIKELLQTT
ncbi:uncharacterized protein Pyn_07381 [Prunus yedoensis var. nudiflora]|uniref:CAAX prenyl protease 2/Lysostaphin resistance protein A-like domain-containing protein n=1 Tax=Prunus yedoensis var. nudiflora TaxID=2094558 RepID=A0A314ZI25_PRUYE|nr:uncharacterized protein Pyn_07381 [Prunus yedoensis var. nudiflora]